MIIVDVFVPGAAKTKGSMEIRNRATGAMKESVVGSSQWRALMAQAVRDDIARRCLGRTGPYPGAVAVTVVAYLALPGAHALPKMPAATRLTAAVRAAFQPWTWPIWERAGDLDKLVRNVLDALGSTSKNPKMNGGAIVDDNLVCRLVAEKVVAGEQRPAGVRIIVETL